MRKLRDNKGMGVIEMILTTTTLFVLFVIMVSILTGCASKSGMTYKDNNGEKHDNTGTYYVQDPETEVYYIVYSSGYQGGICPRYNADGTLYTGE